MRFFLLILLLIAPLPAHAERLALVIGNADFERSTDLPQTAEDARAMADKLSSLGFRLIGDRAHIDLTRAEMLRQIRALGAAADEGDEVVFYFSGHGIGGTQTNYLMPVNDAEIETKEDVPDLAVDVASILDRLPKGDDGVNLFILDACRDNPLPSRAKSAYAQKGLVSVSRGASNTVFLYAAGPGERAYVSDNGRSYFTDALLSALGVPGEDLSDLMRRVRQQVAVETRGKSIPQLPWIEGLTSQPFFFRPGAPTRPDTIEVPVLASDEGAALAQAISANTLAAYTEFRDRFPRSSNLSFVSAKIVELTPPPPVSLLRAGSVFQDKLQSGGQGPEMVVIPSGSFRMGSPSSETGREDDEDPQRMVRIGYRFAVGKFEVTVEQFEKFVADTGYDASNRCQTLENGSWYWRENKNWQDPGFQQSSGQPVVCVDWNAANAFAGWLSRKTGERYRLLSEAEWEYVARAGTAGRFGWGDSDPTCSRGASNGANFASCANNRTEPVGFSSANAFGVYDMHGNVLEWTQDCYVNSYFGAPTDGSPRMVGDCSQRVLRGGSWLNNLNTLRSANRDRNKSSDRYGYDAIGFRVARTL